MTTRRAPHRNPRPAFAALRERPHADVLIIGAGINGIATFRDLALNGVDVTLIDRGDLAGATSAASSRMIHGGLRYLETGEFRLVREAVAERNELLATAPHLVRPLPTTIPLRSTWSGLAQAPAKILGMRAARRERGSVLVRMGLALYDSYSHAGRAADGTGVPRHTVATRERAHQELPDLHPDVRETATYYDAGVYAPERLALELVLDALAANPRARVATYVEASGAEHGAVRLSDVLTGEAATMRPRLLVNASGPWTDLTNAALGAETQWMGGTKGSHLVVDHPELLHATRGREIFFEHPDGRILLLYPQHGRVILGTTDIPADPREPLEVTADEIDYILGSVRDVFPDITVTRAHIVHRYVGIRPLPRTDAETPGAIPRDYRLEHETLAGIPSLSIVGGKWTTARALGEKTADAALAVLGAKRVDTTKGRPIGGGRDFPRPDDRSAWVTAHLPGRDDSRAAALLDRYGTRAREVVRVESERVRYRRALKHAPTYTRGEITWIARTERVETLADVTRRRTQLTFRGEVTPALLEELAKIVGRELGWSRRRRAEEVDAALPPTYDTTEPSTSVTPS